MLRSGVIEAALRMASTSGGGIDGDAIIPVRDDRFDLDPNSQKEVSPALWSANFSSRPAYNT